MTPPEQARRTNSSDQAQLTSAARQVGCATPPPTAGSANAMTWVSTSSNRSGSSSRPFLCPQAWYRGWARSA